MFGVRFKRAPLHLVGVNIEADPQGRPAQRRSGTTSGLWLCRQRWDTNNRREFEATHIRLLNNGQLTPETTGCLFTKYSGSWGELCFVLFNSDVPSRPHIYQQNITVVPKVQNKQHPVWCACGYLDLVLFIQQPILYVFMRRSSFHEQSVDGKVFGNSTTSQKRSSSFNWMREATATRAFPKHKFREAQLATLFISFKCVVPQQTLQGIEEKALFHQGNEMFDQSSGEKPSICCQGFARWPDNRSKTHLSAEYKNNNT